MILNVISHLALHSEIFTDIEVPTREWRAILMRDVTQGFIELVVEDRPSGDPNLYGICISLKILRVHIPR